MARGRWGWGALTFAACAIGGCGSSASRRGEPPVSNSASVDTSPRVLAPNGLQVAANLAAIDPASTDTAAVAPAGLPPPATAAASAAPVAPPPQLSTKNFWSWIWEKPRFDRSATVGYLRAGGRVSRADEPYAGTDAAPCRGHWYRVEPSGYVCAGTDGITLDLTDPTVVAASKYPPRVAPLPYAYGTTTGVALYSRVPTDADRRAVEGGGAPAKSGAELALPLGPSPPFLEGHAQAPVILPGFGPRNAPRANWAPRDTYLAFLAAFETEGRAYYLTTEEYVVPADRIEPALPSHFHGIELAAPGEPGVHLPLVWARFPPDAKVQTHVYKLADGVLAPTAVSLPYQSYAPISAPSVSVNGVAYHELLAPPDGLPNDSAAKYVVSAAESGRLDAVTALPEHVNADEIWVDVNIRQQILAVYRGQTPIYATLVSTGQGTGSKVTPSGNFRVYQKHLTAKMVAEYRPPGTVGPAAEAGYRFDDVPYVQYLVGGIAIHTAFWHNNFGVARSHGCINVSPADAQYIFNHTLPQLPPGWHGIYTGHGGIPAGTLFSLHR